MVIETTGQTTHPTKRSPDIYTKKQLKPQNSRCLDHISKDTKMINQGDMSAPETNSHITIGPEKSNLAEAQDKDSKITSTVKKI